MEKTINLIFKKPEDSAKADTLYHTISLLALMFKGQVSDHESVYFVTITADPAVINCELLYVNDTDKKAFATLTDKDGNPAIFNLTTGDNVYCDCLFDKVDDDEAEDDEDGLDNFCCCDVEDDDDEEEIPDGPALPPHDIAVTLVKSRHSDLRNIVDVSVHLSSSTDGCINNDLHNILMENKFDIIDKWEEARKSKHPRIDVYAVCFNRDDPDKEVGLSCKFSSYEDFADWVDDLKLRTEPREESLVGDFWPSDDIFKRLTGRFRTFSS